MWMIYTTTTPLGREVSDEILISEFVFPQLKLKDKYHKTIIVSMTPIITPHESNINIAYSQRFTQTG